MILAAPLSFAQADSARAVATVYTVTVLTTLPLVTAAIAAIALRRATAEARVLVWRSTVAVLLLAFVGRIPGQVMAWVVPSALAVPLVALGRVQVTVASLRSLGGSPDLGAPWTSSFLLVRMLLALYVAGASLVLCFTIMASLRIRRRVARSCMSFDLGELLDETRSTVGLRKAVRVVISPAVVVPLTWGTVRPVVVLPVAALTWSRSELAIVLRHEFTHIRAADWAFALAGSLACALYWFHPAAWWVAHRLRTDCELTCDDRVIASGVRRSEYAELLVKVADAMSDGINSSNVALALSRRSGLRDRLAMLVGARHDARPLGGAWAPAAAVATFAIALAMSAVRIAPSREVLTTLMSDARWESRAYAVLGLAQRQDSVAVVRTATELDPSPRVRAWARYALGAAGAVGATSARPVDLQAVSHD